MKRLNDVWYKVKLDSKDGEPEYHLINFPCLISMIISLDESDILELTQTKVGFKSE